MKVVAYLLGIVCIIAAGVYLAMPADHLPSFMPGFDAGIDRIRLKHGLVSGAVGIALFGIGWFVGRKS
jgi:hypothetical protein